jgi:hypothetical protein
MYPKDKTTRVKLVCYTLIAVMNFFFELPAEFLAHPFHLTLIPLAHSLTLAHSRFQVLNNKKTAGVGKVERK